MYPFRWLDEGEDDGQIERTLSVLPQPGIPWLITTVTSTEAGAGSQGPAALVLYTNCGKSKQVIFGDEPNTIFDDGQLQNFPVHVSDASFLLLPFGFVVFNYLC